MAYNRKEKIMISSPEPVTLKSTEKIIEQMNNSVCKINNNDKGMGFFVKIPYKSTLLPVLIASNQTINIYDIKINKYISLYLNNDKKIKTIKLDNNRLTYTNEKLNITIIEIKESEDNLNNKYLELDDEIINFFALNKIHEPNYYNESIYSLNYYDDKNIFASYGKILEENNKEIMHQCIINQRASFAPILLTNNQKLIGINKGSSKRSIFNKGELLIYSIIEFRKIISKNSRIVNKEGKKLDFNKYNLLYYIIGELDIKMNKQKTRIINSYEQSRRENKFIEYKKENENEKEIKEKCEIKINGKSIPFSYFHEFNEKGKYTILYTFKKNMTNTNYLFSECSSLTSLNFYYFNTESITNMSNMFSYCSSLTYINLSNFNTKNVTDMNHMFSGCSSLTNIDLSNFNTQKVTNMNFMFYECTSLTRIDLYNFDLNYTKDVRCMLFNCKKLTKKNIITKDKKILNQFSTK